MSRPMFNPRGSFSSPRYPNQGGSNMPRGPFMGGMRMEGSRPRMSSEGHAFRGLPQGFTVSEAFTRLHALGLQTPGQDRSKMMDVQLPQHREDPRLTKEQLAIQDLPLRMGVQESPPINRSEHGQWPFAGTHTEHMPTDFGSSRLDEPSPRSQNRYNSESASSILASFGLSNEDLEELSHYPDDQLTPENMPLILREIRMRKLSRPEEPSSGFSFSKDTENIVKGNVIDYGHASKYGYSEDPLERMLDSDLPNQDIERPKYDCLPETSVSSMRGSRDFPSQMGNEPSLQSVTQPAFPGSKRDEKVKPVSEENVQPGLPIEALVTSVGDSRNKNKPPGKNGPGRNLKNLENQNPQSFGIQSSQNFGSQAPPNFGNQAPLPYGNHPPVTFGNQPPAAFGSSAPPMFGNQAAGTALAQPAFPVAQGSWKPPPATPSDVKVTKKLPTPSMMNDYYATTPRIYPHMCSLCNVECRHLKDWIEHQNTASHIESCRRLRQQYPDWNPEVLSSARKDVDAKAKEGTKTRSASPRRRRSRSRSTSACRAPHSRSRSPRHLDSRRESHRRIRTRSRSPRNAGALRRSRSRSPRSSGVHRRSRSPRNASGRRSRSPRNASGRRSRSPRHASGRRSRSPRHASGRRSRSPRHASGRRSRSPRHASGRRSRSPRGGGGVQHKISPRHDSLSRKSPSPGKIASSQEPDNKTTEQNKTIGKVVKPVSVNKVQPVIGKIPRADYKGKGTVSHLSKLELEETNKLDFAVEKPVKKQETDKAKKLEADKLRKPDGDKTKKDDVDRVKKTELQKAKKTQPISKLTSSPKVPAQSGVSKPFISATPSSWEVLKPAEQFLKDKWMDGTIIHITELPDSGYTDQDILKLTMPFGKANDILIVRSKNEAFLEMAYKEAAEAVVDFSKTTPLMIGGKQVAVCIAGHDRSLERELGRKKRESSQRGPAAKFGGPALAGKPAEPKVAVSAADGKLVSSGKTSAVTKPAGKNSAEPARDKTPIVKAKPKDVSKTVMKKAKSEDQDATCCLLVTELPAEGYTEEDLYRMAAPFGSVHDLIILATERKAYMELTSVKAAEAMLNFYSFLPVTLHGSQLKLKKLAEDFDITDMEAVFTDAVGFADFEKEADYYGKLVIVNNLPAEYTELEVLCLGLRFGNVQKYVFMKNKRRAVLKLNKPGAAAAMCKFFKVYPYSLRDSVLSFSLSPKLAALEGEDDKKVPVNESTDKNSTVESASNTDKVAPSSNTTEDSTKTSATASSQPKATTALHSSCTSKDAGKPKTVSKPKEVKGSAIVSQKPSVPPSKLSPAAAITVKSSSASLSPVKPKLSPSFVAKDKTASVPATKPAPALVSPAKPKPEPITFSFVVPEDKLRAAIESSTLSSEEGKPTSSSVSSGHSKAASVSSTTFTEKPKLVADAATSEEQMDENGKGPQHTTVAVPPELGDLHVAAADSNETAAGAASKITLSQTDAPCAKGPFQKSETVPAKSDSKSKLATKQDTRKESDTGKLLSTDAKQLSHTSSTRHSIDGNKDRVGHSATRSGSRRGHSPYEKDRRLEHKDISRYCRERERSSGKRDDDRSKHSSGRSTRTSKSIYSSKLPRAQQKVEEITFSFNLDDYVTVDEIGDETDEPSVRVNVVDDPEKSASVGEESLVQPGIKKEGSVSKDSTDDKREVKASAEMLPSVDSSSAKETLYLAAHSDKDADISSVLPCSSGIPKCTLHPFGSEEKKDISEGLCTSSSASEENALKSESLTQKRSDLPEDLSSIPCMAVHTSIKHDSFQMQADELEEGDNASRGVPLSLPNEKSIDASDSKPASANDPVLSALQSNAQKIGVSKAGQPCIPIIKKESLLQHETPKGKKVVHTKDINSDSRSKKKKSTDAVVDDFSFVTLDEIGEEDSSLSNETAVVGPHNEENTLVTVDEVGSDDLREIEKELHIQVKGDASSVVRLPVSADVEKSENMVEDFKARIEEMPSGTGNISACNVTLPLVAFSESQGDKKEQPVGTSDENTEDDDDACTFFSALKGDMSFVTVDEIGGDDEDQITELEASAVDEDQIKEDSSNVKEIIATSTGARGKKRKQSPGEVQTRSKKAAIEEEGAQQTSEAESQGALQAAAESVPQLTDKEKK